MLKKLAIIFVAVFGVLLAVPTMVPSLSGYFPSWIKPIPLGLDLKGGAQLLLEVDTSTMFKDKSVQLYDDVRSALIDRNKGIIRFSGLRNVDNVVSLNIRDSGDISDAKGRLKSVLGAGVDIKSDGNTITVSYTEKQKQEMVNEITMLGRTYRECFALAALKENEAIDAVEAEIESWQGV